MSNDGVPFTPLLINGRFRPASDGKTFDTVNAYSKKVVGRAAAASSQDCKDAVETAAKAFVAWEQTPLAQRRDVFLRAADLMSTEKWQQKVLATMKDEVSAVDPMLVFFNIPAVISLLRHTAGLISHLKGETFPSDVPGGYVVSQRRGMGVVLAIAPWNVPMYLSMRAVMIPIICGNAVVLKSSEITPRSQAIVGEVFKEAGLPDGVLNYLCIDRADAPALTKEMIAHPAVKKINFTGSDRVGKIIAGEAARFLKPCVFELGGKCPVVVLDDADIDAAAKAIVSSALLHSGQICMSTERVIVQRKASETLVPAVQKYMGAVKAGEVDLNPLTALFTEDAAENVLNMLKDAEQQGAKILVGDIKREGAVVQPHLVVDTKPGMLIWERETFGPVTTMIVADTIDEIVELANQSNYSLNAALWTNDVHLAMDVGSRIRAGQTSINGPTIHVENMRGLTGLGGATGYGHFDVDSFTDIRSLVFHSKAYRSYPVVG